MKISANVVRHGRYITFQSAGVAIPRTLFIENLRLIDGLRPSDPRASPELFGRRPAATVGDPLLELQ